MFQLCMELGVGLKECLEWTQGLGGGGGGRLARDGCGGGGSGGCGHAFAVLGDQAICRLYSAWLMRRAGGWEGWEGWGVGVNNE